MLAQYPYYQATTAKSQLSLRSTASSGASVMGIHVDDFPPMPPSPSISQFSGSMSSRFAPGPNFEGSWLDLDSDDEDEPAVRRLTSSRSRKNSLSGPKDSASAAQRSAFSGFSARLRKLTARMVR
ncbi:hypothetical protein H4R18_005311 [Coemansia javaensis]|uniref:Uncharacterized protein n=1 Tax=Coemansia javaensis TaxID=2761396 RepID=A0A9W8LF00_9FUNG|nr:hypothetical protein H4R18_005311 [Coemansia javaensis]